MKSSCVASYDTVASYDMKTGYLIRQRREAAGMSAAALAAKAKLSSAHVSHIESGRIGSPEVDTLQKIARALGITIGELLDEQGAA